MYRETDTFVEHTDYSCSDIAVCEVIEDDVTYFATISQNRCSMFPFPCLHPL